MSNKQFTNIEVDELPIVNFIDKKSDSALLDMDYMNPKNDIFWFKFRLIISAGKKQSIKIRHGYSFNVADKSLMIPPSKIMTDFFAKLIFRSIEEANKNIINWNVQISIEILVNVVDKALMARKN